jgi:cytidyltransferase-like protein
VNKVALFSGRFDPVHLGHIITLGRLLKKYSKVIVCILDYPEREVCDIKKAIEILETFLKLWCYERNRVIIGVNKTHFAKISLKEIEFICNTAVVSTTFYTYVYVGGNEEVNKHIKSIGFPVEYIPRSYFYRATSIREEISKGKTLGDILKNE